MNRKEDQPLIPTRDKYARYRRSANGVWEVKNKLDDDCWKMWHGCRDAPGWRWCPAVRQDAHYVQKQSFRRCMDERHSDLGLP